MTWMRPQDGPRDPATRRQAWKTGDILSTIPLEGKQKGNRHLEVGPRQGPGCVRCEFGCRPRLPRALKTCPQTELTVNPNLSAPETPVVVSNVRQGVADTHAIATGTRSEPIKSKEGADANQPVSVTRVSFIKK